MIRKHRFSAVPIGSSDRYQIEDGPSYATISKTSLLLGRADASASSSQQYIPVLTRSNTHRGIKGGGTHDATLLPGPSESWVRPQALASSWPMVISMPRGVLDSWRRLQKPPLSSLDPVIPRATSRTIRTSTTTTSRRMIEKAPMPRIWRLTRTKTRAKAKAVGVATPSTTPSHGVPVSSVAIVSTPPCQCSPVPCLPPGSAVFTSMYIFSSLRPHLTASASAARSAGSAPAGEENDECSIAEAQRAHSSATRACPRRALARMRRCVGDGSMREGVEDR